MKKTKKAKKLMLDRETLTRIGESPLEKILGGDGCTKYRWASCVLN